MKGRHPLKLFCNYKKVICGKFPKKCILRCEKREARADAKQKINLAWPKHKTMTH